MSPRTRGFNDVPSPHDKSHPPNYGGKVRPMGAPPPRRSELGPPSEPVRRPSALPIVLGVVIVGALVAVVAYFWQHPSPAQPTDTGSVIEVKQ